MSKPLCPFVFPPISISVSTHLQICCHKPRQHPTGIMDNDIEFRKLYALGFQTFSQVLKFR
jgi:hypothetical protein